MGIIATRWKIIDCHHETDRHEFHMEVGAENVWKLVRDQDRRDTSSVLVLYLVI
jgi:hypothetical protein